MKNMNDDVIQILKDSGAILEGHFIGVSGRHLPMYINKDAWLLHTGLVSKVCRMLAEMNKDKKIEVVVGPAVGGVVLSQWTAYHLSDITGKEVLSVFTEKTPEGGQILKRNYDRVVEGKRILAVEDTVTTGGSVKKTIDAITGAGGNVVQLSLIVNRDPKNVTDATFGVPVNALADISMESFGEEEVPDWLKKIPINVSVGHGAEYLKGHPKLHA
jgi:orotate phosphoribosyltransferase